MSAGHSSTESVVNAVTNGTTRIQHDLAPTAPHPSYTRGIHVHSSVIAGVGEFSVWEFAGYTPYHQVHF
jgi:hypothetical protein